jgi:3'(2'), 5'-bisphosphate nucleotidase
MTDQLDPLITIAKDAGAAILNIYENEDFGVQTKADDSPLTKADLAAHEIIMAGLKKFAPDTPVLSEESTEIPYEIRRQWRRYYLVDPLDGTKEFINKNGEFTVNIALIEEGVPVAGVVYVPVTDVTYAGQQLEETTAFVERGGQRQEITTRNLPERLRQNEALVVVASRRHGSEALQGCMEALNENFANVETTNMGSSLKLCLIAEGEADLYPRLAPTSEWDTAAAQAVVEAAGGLVVDSDLKPLRYNIKSNILNPFFYVIADKSFDWDGILKGV